MAKIDDSLRKRNQDIIKQANPLFDELNASWDKIEKFFRAQGILQPTSVAYDDILHFHQPLDPNSGETIAIKYIGLEKIRGKWQVCYGVQSVNEDDIATWIPVSECSVELRVELLDHVGLLFKKLVESNAKYVPVIEKAVAKSHSVLKDLGI